MCNSDFGVIDVVADFCRAWERVGGTPNELASLVVKKRAMKMLRKFANGQARIVSVDHVICCDEDPHVPDGFKTEEHRKSGKFKWNSDNATLFLVDSQRGDNQTTGHELRKELVDQPVMCAHTLDYLVNNPTLIPESWQGQVVVFWGTIYRDCNGKLCVGYLDFIRGFWCRKYLNLDEMFAHYAPACCHTKPVSRAT